MHSAVGGAVSDKNEVLPLKRADTERRKDKPRNEPMVLTVTCRLLLFSLFSFLDHLSDQGFGYPNLLRPPPSTA